MCGERRAALPQPPEGGLQLNAGVGRTEAVARATAGRAPCFLLILMRIDTGT
jgi:hypothetical protein